MDREANLPVAPGPAGNLIRPTAKPPDTTSSSFSSSPPDFLRNVQAAFKRHRPLGIYIPLSLTQGLLFLIMRKIGAFFLGGGRPAGRGGVIRCKLNLGFILLFSILTLIILH